jgi:hypothetical protein
VLLVVGGVLPPERAFVGFSSPATITIAGLFVVAQAIRDHLGLERLLDDLLEVDGQGPAPVLLRLLPPVTLLSGVVNNTPIVATTAPIVRSWAERRGVASSRLLIPLSFATILGGTLTTIGTSTNLVVSGALEAAGREPLGFFAVGPARAADGASSARATGGAVGARRARTRRLLPGTRSPRSRPGRTSWVRRGSTVRDLGDHAAPEASEPSWSSVQPGRLDAEGRHVPGRYGAIASRARVAEARGVELWPGSPARGFADRGVTATWSSADRDGGRTLTVGPRCCRW